MFRCPDCDRPTLQVRPVVRVLRLGAYSLSGAQDKVSAVTRHVLACWSCMWQVEGYLEGATLTEDGSRFTGGYFVPDRKRDQR